MYLSRLNLNGQHRQAAQDQRNAYGLHQSLRWAFPNAGLEGGPLPDGERLLWRSEGDQGLLVQSVTRPDWQALEDRWPGYLRAVQVKPLALESLLEGQELLFRLRANVTVNRWRDGQNRETDPRTKREALRGAVEQVEWLGRQGERGGFAVVGADIVQSGNVRLYKSRSASPVTLFAVTFEGLIRVQQPQALISTVQGGIGKAKSLGFGLLSLAPASHSAP